MKKTTGKVQPKKETVRINLPPKPSAAPTIKLPTLPPGGPTGAPVRRHRRPRPAPRRAAPALQRTTAAAPVSQQRPAPAAATARRRRRRSADSTKVWRFSLRLPALAALASRLIWIWMLTHRQLTEQES